MSGGDDPTQPRPAKFPKQSNPTTTIESLGEDLLLTIFLRLPSLATLIRVALTCRAWRRAVASSPSFRRSFRELHPAPLLVIFEDPDRDALPPFVAAHRRDRHVLAAIRGGDFFLTPLLEPNSCACDAPLRWRVVDFRDGCIVLMNRVAGLLAIVNPLARQCPADYIHIPFDMCSRDGPLPLGVHLLSSDEEPMPFRVVWLLCDITRVQLVVFSSETRDWSFLPWVEITERVPPHDANNWWLRWGM
ncbi:uncharacterized protein LOC112895031 [Panicum hallii]|jgi:hypothetical protein|uniref:uncharacterized protein LOC112895031 n=1 Tax=Panicum hallii TaxID=206008 RepID=UPI000DF4E4E1|nr:uncharacterized protein LOC112895031 [Panicum hallii]